MFEKVKAILRDCRGITLVELLVALSLLTIVSVALFNFIGFSQRSWYKANSNAAITSEAQVLLMQVERDIRFAKRGSEGQPGIEILNQGHGLRVNKFVNGDERIIRYLFQSGNILTREVLTPAGETVMEMVYDNVFQGVDEDGQLLPVFSTLGNKVRLKCFLENPPGQVTKKLEVDTLFAVRGKGVM